jgi:hypothetical protein
MNTLAAVAGKGSRFSAVDPRGVCFALTASELAMNSRRKYIHRASIGVVGGIGDKLIVN